MHSQTAGACRAAYLSSSRPSRTTACCSIAGQPCSSGYSAAVCALRIETAGRSIAYSGDTTWDESLIELARGSDLFICECCNYAETSPVHLDYLTLKQHLTELKAARIILTHTGLQIDQNRKPSTLRSPATVCVWSFNPALQLFFMIVRGHKPFNRQSERNGQ